MTNDVIYTVESRPPTRKLILFALQQFLSVITATITVPILIGLGDHMSAALLGCGLGTLVYLLCTKRKSPVVISSSFAYIGALILAVQGYGYLGICLGGIFSGSVYVIISIIIHFVGTAWIDKIMPPVVIGPVVACIGLGLAPSAITNLISASGFVDATGEHPYNLLALFCGLIGFFVIVICSIQGRFKTMKMLPFLLGIGAGYLVALLFSAIGYGTGNTYLEIIDFSPLTNLFQTIELKTFLSYPRVSLIEGIKEITSGTAKLNGVGVLEIFLAFVPVAFVAFAEHIADHKNLGVTIGRDLVNGEPGLSRTLMGDGLGSVVGTLFGVCPNTTYGESIGCTALSGCSSWWAILLTAVLAIVSSFLSPVSAFLQTIPSCVVGGACLALYGFIAVSGLRMLKDVDLSLGKNLFTVSVIMVTALGGLTLQIPYKLGYLDGTDFYGVAKFIAVSNIAIGLVLGVLTYRLSILLEPKKPKEEIIQEEK